MENVERLFSQLQAEKAFYKYDYGGAALDPWLTETLAKLLAKAGISDIRDITLFEGWTPYAGDTGVQWVRSKYLYNALTGQAIQGIGGFDSGDPNISAETIATTSNADYVFTFLARFSPDGSPYFVVAARPVLKVSNPGSWWKGIASAIAPLLPVIMVGLSFAAPGLGLAIGNAVLGPALAAASPALAAGIGNVAISTALSGGDIERAVSGAVIGSLGGAVGGITIDATGSEWIGKAAGAATSAAVSGGDLKTAVASSLLTSGARNMSDFLNVGEASQTQAPLSFAPDESLFPGSGMMAYHDPVYDAPADFAPVNANPDLNFGTGGVSFTPDVAGSIFDTTSLFPSAAAPTGAPDPWSMSTYTNLASDPWNISAANLGPTSVFDLANPYQSSPADLSMSTYLKQAAALNPLTPAAAPTDKDSGFNIDSLVNLAVAAIKINQAYQNAGKPAVQVARTNTATGTVTVPNKNGTIVTTTANGKTTITKMPVGVPYMTPDGTTLINNGDGTYTSVSPAGFTATNRYAADAALGVTGGSTNMLMIGGVALLAILAMR